jgi:hypothetical protein
MSNMSEPELRSSAEVTRELESLLNRQLDLYRKLRGLADRQRQLVTQDDPQPLLALLGERQELVDELAGLSEVLLPAQRAWRRCADQVEPAVRTRIEQLLQRISGTLQSVLDSDAEDTRRLASRRQRAHQEVEQIHEGQRALTAYQALAPSTSRFAATDHSA